MLAELPEFRTEPLHPLIEGATVLALWLGSAMGFREIRRLLRQKAHLDSRMRAASGAFLSLLEESFAAWGLTPSERDVALLAIKGLSTGEIAGLRETREGTVRAQCTAVYRKAGVEGRAQLVSHFIEDLMSGAVVAAPAVGAPQLD
jgi:DNA-binding CsgD family transcriptional regulator